VLKGGMLLAAYDLRRPTADVDLAALQTSNEVDEVRQLITEVAAAALPAGLDDGLTFDLTNVTAEAIRDEDASGRNSVRLRSQRSENALVERPLCSRASAYKNSNSHCPNCARRASEPAS
jgi:Nucleotidyl transferase AbiEii toxin, Type IV TA system